MTAARLCAGMAHCACTDLLPPHCSLHVPCCVAYHFLCRLAVIGEMKMFVGLAKDRLAGLSVTPTMGLSRHVRTLCLLGFILCSNALGLGLLHRHQGALSWAISLLFALDLGIISVEASKAALRWAGP